MVNSRILPPLLIGTAFFAAAAFAVLLTRFEGGVAHLWLATSILAAELMARPRRNWMRSIIPCAVASMLVTGFWGLGWAMAVPFAAINIIEATTAAWLFRRFADPRRPLGSLGWLLHFVVSVGLAAPIVAGSLATAALWSSGIAPMTTFATFVTGHGLGNLTFTPIALLLTRSNRRELLRDLRRRDLVETVALLMLAVAVTCGVFVQESFPLLFLPALPIIVIAFRVGRGGVAISIALLALIGGIATASGNGPVHLVDASFGHQMQFFQFFIAATVLTILPVTADLENRARLHRDLRASEERFRLLAEHSTDILLHLDPSGRIRYVSPSMRQLSGHDPASLVGHYPRALIAPEHLGRVTAEHLRTMRMGGETNRYEYLAMLADGSTRWFETHARAVIDLNGEVEGMVQIARDISAQKANELRLAAEAMTDPLTGLPNRRSFKAAIDRCMTAPQDGISHCIAVFDIDRFKDVNDKYGHDAGDGVLRTFADILRQVVRDSDAVARIGGEEFAAFFPSTSIDRALVICDRVRTEMASMATSINGEEIHVTVSGGVAWVEKGGPDLALKQADLALYTAKRCGRDQMALAA